MHPFQTMRKGQSARRSSLQISAPARHTPGAGADGAGDADDADEATAARTAACALGSPSSRRSTVSRRPCCRICATCRSERSRIADIIWCMCARTARGGASGALHSHWRRDVDGVGAARAATLGQCTLRQCWQTSAEARRQRGSSAAPWCLRDRRWRWRAPSPRGRARPHACSADISAHQRRPCAGRPSTYWTWIACGQLGARCKLSSRASRRREGHSARARVGASGRARTGRGACTRVAQRRPRTLPLARLRVCSG